MKKSAARSNTFERGCLQITAPVQENMKQTHGFLLFKTTSIIVFMLLLSSLMINVDGSRHLKHRGPSQKLDSADEQTFVLKHSKSATFHSYSSSKGTEYRAYSGPSNGGTGH